MTLESVVRATILVTLADHAGNRTETAKCLGISLRSLRDKLSKYRKQGFKPAPPKRGVKGARRS